MDFPERYDRMIQTIEDSLDDSERNRPKVLTKKLAADLGMTPRGLNEAFRLITDMTLGSYIRRRRLVHAVAYKEKHQVSFEDIAEKYGYADASALSNAFYRTFGIYPSAAGQGWPAGETPLYFIDILDYHQVMELERRTFEEYEYPGYETYRIDRDDPEYKALMRSAWPEEMIQEIDRIAAELDKETEAQKETPSAAVPKFPEPEDIDDYEIPEEGEIGWEAEPEDEWEDYNEMYIADETENETIYDYNGGYPDDDDGDEDYYAYEMSSDILESQLEDSIHRAYGEYEYDYSEDQEEY